MSKAKYKLVPTNSFLKDLKKKVAPNDRRKVDRALNSLVKNPYQGRKLKAKPFAKLKHCRIYLQNGITSNTIGYKQVRQHPKGN